MLTKIKLFAYIYNENLQKQVPFFSNGGRGGGAPGAPVLEPPLLERLLKRLGEGQGPSFVSENKLNPFRP